MKVYLVGVHCFYEGGGWDEVVLDNENLITNIKIILFKYLDKELGSSLEDIKDDFFIEEWDIIQEQIDEVNICRKALLDVSTLDGFRGLSMVGSDVVSVREVEVYE